MGDSPFAAVTVVDTATSVGLADATAYILDSRFGNNDFPVMFAGTNSSVGAGDAIRVYVSPDASKDYAGMYVQAEAYTTTAFTGVITGNWAGVKFVKNGTGGTGKVVAYMAGFTRRNDQV